MFKKLLAAAALTVCTATANAGVITQSFWFGDDNTTGTQALVVTSGGGANIEELELNWGPQTFSFNLFDTQGGTLVLNSVELILNGTSTGNISGTNTGTNDADIELNLGAVLSVRGFGGSIDLVTVFPQYSNIFEDVASGDSVTSGNISTSASNSESYSSSSPGPFGPIIYSSFIGTGTGDIQIDAEGEADAGAGGSGSITFFNTAEGSLDIVYNFTDLTAVPEPGYLAMFGFLLMAMTRLRKK